MNKKEFNNKFEEVMDRLLTEASADKLATEVAGSANNMLILGLVKNVHRLAKAQEAQSAFLSELKPVIQYFVEKAKTSIAEEEADKANREEVRSLRREQELYELRKAKARREIEGDEEKAAAEAAKHEADRQAAREAREAEYDRKRELEMLKPKANMKLRVMQTLGPRCPNIVEGQTIQVKYIDCFRGKDDYRADPKVVLEQGLTLNSDEWKAMIVNEILVPIAD